MSEHMRSYDDADENLDRFPTAGEVEAVLKDFLKDIPYKVVTSKIDANGGLVFEIETIINGEKTEYNYQQAKYDHTKQALAPGARFSASIHATFYDSDEMPVGGKCILNYKDGKWSAPTEK